LGGTAPYIAFIWKVVAMETDVNSSTTPTPENSLRKTFGMYLILGVVALLLAACLLGVMGLLSLTDTDGTEALTLRLGSMVTLSGLSGLLLLIVFVAGYHQIAEVDRLLSGKSLLAHWRYTVDEHGQPKTGYVYIGPTGVYKDGVYVWFVGRSRQLVKVSYEAGLPAKLRFVYRVISRPNSRSPGGSALYNSLDIPIPAGQDEEARRVAAEFSHRVTGTLA
jgi:hypothetical protein